MKKLSVVLLALVLLAAVGGSAFAWESWEKKGDVSVGAGLGLHFPFGLAVYPGVEWIFSEWKVGDTVPLSFGLAGKGVVDWWSGWGLSFGAGAFVTAHLGLKGLDIPDFLQKLDWYVGLGFGVLYASWWADYLGTGGAVIPSFASVDGVNYFLNDKLALFLEYNYWSYSGAAFGVLFKL